MEPGDVVGRWLRRHKARGHELPDAREAAPPDGLGGEDAIAAGEIMRYRSSPEEIGARRRSSPATGVGGDSRRSGGRHLGRLDTARGLQHEGQDPGLECLRSLRGAKGHRHDARIE